MKKYAPASTAYQRIVREAARDTIQAWLHSLDYTHMHFFQADGVECGLQFFMGYWGLVEGGRWRWGRGDAGDPDENTSGDDVLIEIALGRALPPQPPTVRRRRNLVALSGEAELTRAEIRALVSARARENLNKLVLYAEPRA